MALRRCHKRRAVPLGETECCRQEVEGVPARCLMDPPLEILQTSLADLRPLGQHHLRQAGTFAEGLEHGTEARGGGWAQKCAPSPWHDPRRLGDTCSGLRR